MSTYIPAELTDMQRLMGSHKKHLNEALLLSTQNMFSVKNKKKKKTKHIWPHYRTVHLDFSKLLEKVEVKYVLLWVHLKKKIWQ